MRRENLAAILGSLRRRVSQRRFLEMEVELGGLTAEGESEKLDLMSFSTSLIPDCVSLLNSVGSLDYWHRARFQKDILETVRDPESDIFLVRKGGGPAAISVLHPPSPGENRAEIGFVAVSPKFRGNRLGHRLLMHILMEARKRNIKTVYLLTDGFRIPAIRTYLRCGFKPRVRDADDETRWQKIFGKLSETPRK